MSQPTPYDRVTSFDLAQQTAPSNPLTGADVDAEFNAVKLTLDQILANLSSIQRDDGRLANNSVGRLQLDASLNLGFNPPTAWDDAVSYDVIDTVFFGGKFYRCLVSHISSVFATDLAAGKWGLIADFAGALGSAINVGFTPSGTIGATNTQAAIEEVSSDVETLLARAILQTPPTIPTPASSDNSTRIATTAFTQSVVSAAVAAAVAALVPIGSIMVWPGTTAPTGWQVCDGAAYPRAHPLFAVLGTTYGTGDGSTTANLPDLRGRVIIAKDAGAGRITSAGSGLDGNVLGATGGAQNVQLQGFHMPAHTHGVSDLGHTHGVSGGVWGGASHGNALGSQSEDVPRQNAAIQIVSATSNISIQAAGNDIPHLNVQPSIVMNYIIRVS
jgi:microcystin-dependent protein